MLTRVCEEPNTPGPDSALARENAELRRQAAIDREIIRDLEGERFIDREMIANLQVALGSARMIGAAQGIIMAGQKLTEEAAFGALRRASQRTHLKLRDVAAQVVLTGILDA